MQQTASVTVYTQSIERMGWEDQSKQTTQQRFQIDEEVFFAIVRLADSTHDGGIFIDHNSSIRWRMYDDGDHIVNVLPGVNEIFAGTVKCIDSLLPLHQSAVELPLDAIHWMESMTGLSQDRIGKLIGVSRQAINVWKRGGRIADENRQRILAVRDVLKRALAKHPTKDLLMAWLDTPRGSDGRTPAQLLEANEINRARLLAMAVPSPHIKTVPSWVNRPIPEAFRAGAERRQEALPRETESELTKLIESGEYGIDEDGGAYPLK